jgi:hypothetical protein
MSGVPRLKFSSEIFLPCVSQFRHDSGVLHGQPIVELIQRFDGREHLFWDLDHFACHKAIVAPGQRKDTKKVISGQGSVTSDKGNLRKVTCDM